VIDLFSRQVVGWSMKPHMQTSVVTDALHMAWFRRRPAPGLIFHSDRGSQYCSHDFQKALKGYKMKSSMSRKGNCWDNAPMERVFRSLKTEWIPTTGYRTAQEAQRDISQFLMHRYNWIRPHQFNGGLAPARAEEKLNVVSGIS
jgi:putative transposase